MARYYFDIDDGERFTRDEMGQEIETRASLRAKAIRALPDIAQDKLPNGDRHVFVVTVRDEHNTPVFRASLSLDTEWLV